MAEPKVVNRHRPAQVLTPFMATATPTIYVGRGTPYGNRNQKVSENERGKVLQMHLDDLCMMEVNVLRRLCSNLVGSDLECSCAPKPCHADTWLALANPHLPLPSWMNSSQKQTLTDLRAAVHGN
jgi:hypothetical protein